MSLIEILNSSLAGRADAVALEYPASDGSLRELTFGEIDARSDVLASVLAARGFRRGDRLAFFLANRVEIIDILLACIKTGVIAVPVNVLYREAELTHIIADSEPKAVIAARESARFLPAGTNFWAVEDLASEKPASAHVPVGIGDDQPVMLVYTSGTTGKSKGAVLTRGNLAFNAQTLTGAWRITETDRYLAVLPLFHVHGLANGLGCWLASGCRMRLAERFDASQAEALFESFRPTLFFGVPTIYFRLLELGDEAARRIGSRARLFVSGSAPLPAAVLEGFERKFGHRILERYGMSETLMNTSNPYEGERRAGSVGFPLPGVEVRIVDGGAGDVRDGKTGEILVRGPNVFSGYWRNSAATAAAFAGDWFRTGDLAVRSIDGYITLCGRRSELIISGGFNIYPREIEDLLLHQPGVLEAAVCGAKDERKGEVPVAYIVADGEFDEESVAEACRRSLASFKMPRVFIRVGELPRNALGKVQKHLLPEIKTMTAGD